MDEQKILADSKNYAENLIKSITASLIVISPEGIILSVNPYTCKMLGFEEQELIGKPINSIIDIKDLIFEDMWIKFLIKKREIKNVERTYIAKDGTRIPSLFSSSIIHSIDGGVEGIICMAQDMSERKRVENELERAQRYAQGLIESSMDMIIAVNIDGHITEFNKAAQKTFGYSMEEVIGINIATLYDNPDESKMIMDDINKTGQFSGEITGRGKNGNIFPIIVSASVLLDSNGQTSGFMQVSRDITERKQAEQLKEQLINELKKTNEELKKSQEQLVQSEKMASLGQLVAGVAHEINTPIGIGVTAASHFQEITENIVSLFENKTMKKSELERYFEDAKESSSLILSNLRRTGDLIISFKMVSSDQTSLVQRVFNMKLYLEDIILSLKPKLKHYPIKIEINCPDNIEIDSFPGAFAQVITNLIMNSLHHAYDKGQQGSININITLQNTTIIIKFIDFGRGIPHQNLKKIFDPFFTTSRGSGGTGLGLNIVFNVVNQTLKGSITCESTVGKGTTFILRIPVKI
jgi:PAS domain S-box-containing protein